MRGQTIRVTTPAGTDITFEIGDRPVTKQDGDASAARAADGQNLIDREIELPAGAIRVAPIEESVEGIIAFPDMVWRGEKVENLIMEFEEGKVVVVDADSNATAVDLELEEAGESARSFRRICHWDESSFSHTGRRRALDSLLWLWFRHHSLIPWRQYRAWGECNRRLCPLEFLH